MVIINFKLESLTYYSVIFDRWSWYCSMGYRIAVLHPHSIPFSGIIVVLRGPWNIIFQMTVSYWVRAPHIVTAWGQSTNPKVNSYRRNDPQLSNSLLVEICTPWRGYESTRESGKKKLVSMHNLKPQQNNRTWLQDMRINSPLLLTTTCSQPCLAFEGRWRQTLNLFAAARAPPRKIGRNTDRPDSFGKQQ